MEERLNKLKIFKIEKIVPDRFAQLVKGFKDRLKSIDDFFDDWDRMKGKPGFEDVSKGIDDALENTGDAYKNAKGRIAEIEHGSYMEKSRGYTIDRMSVRPEGSPFEFDALGRDSRGIRFVSETKSITDESIALMDDVRIDDWMTDHVTNQMNNYKTALTSDSAYADITNVKYTIPDSAYNHPRFNGKFLTAMQNARQTTGLSIEVVVIP